MWAPRHYFFVYRTIPWVAIDVRLPIGGITFRSWDELEAVDQAYRLAEERFPCKEREILVVILQRDQMAKRHALLMEQDKLRADQRFEELMTVEA